MKKLLITSMAAVAVSICAKATETYTYNTTESFESYNQGPLFGRQEEKPEAYEVTDGWVTTATPEDGIFTVTNIENYVGAGTHGTVSRPITDTPNAKALAIDTSNPLMRTVHTTPGSSDDLGEAVFFDSVVQFTATDAKPTPGNDDKLMVWLYASDDVDNDNPGVFGEKTPTTNLVITAGYYESIGANQTKLVVTNYLTGVEIEPDSWHRLTIKSFKDNIGSVFFNVWVDETKVVVDGVTDFSSLLDTEPTLNLKGVAFEGKGAVDDLVFTTKDPFPAPGYEIHVSWTDNVGDAVQSAFYKVDSAETYTALNNGDDLDVLLTNSAITFKFWIADGAKLENGEKCEDEEGDEGYYAWTRTVVISDFKKDGTDTIEFSIVEESESGDDTEKPTLDVTSYANGEDLKADVKSGTKITVPIGWTVDGKELKDAQSNTFATFEYYNLALVDGVVTATLDQKAAAPFAEATDLTEGQEVLDLDETIGEEGSKVPAVGVRIKTYSGLWYGLGTAAELGTSSSWTGPVSWTKSDSDGKVIQLKAAKEGDTRFYRIEVKDINPAQ